MKKDKLTELILKLQSDISLCNFYKDACAQRKAELVAYMQKLGFQKIVRDDISIALVPATTTLSFDSERFKADHEDLYNEYKTKESNRKADLRVTIKEQDEGICTTNE